MKNNWKNHEIDKDDNEYLIPSRDIVARVILENWHNMNNSFKKYILNIGDREMKNAVMGYIIQLFMETKIYIEIIENVDKEYTPFYKKMNNAINKGNICLSHTGIVESVNCLNEAMYHSGLTKIQWDTFETDDLEDMKRVRNND